VLDSEALMPWHMTDPVKERVKFILEWEERRERQEGQVNVAELSRMFGISRQAGHAWIRRYQDANHNLQALSEQTRRPHSSPTAISDELQDLVVAARKHHPRWGPRKLHAWLEDLHPEVALPGASAMGSILKRRGLVTPRRRRRRAPLPQGVTVPFADCTAPNDSWCIDFKGWFRTADGVKCYPLTLLDAFSRYVLRCEIVLDPNGHEVSRILDSAFLEFGLPGSMRSDNGPPFASTGAAGLTKLSVWLLRLGLRLERIVPGKPQQNGRLERMHLTLDEAIDPPRASPPAQQRAFDLWRRVYNEERPHEALGQRPPASVYAPSSRRYPRPLVRPDIGPCVFTCPVDKEGFIRWQRRRVFVSSALGGELAAIEPVDVPGHWEVRYGQILLGRLEDDRLDRGLIIPRRKRGDGVSVISLA
jgi:transposase InsO family protein